MRENLLNVKNSVKLKEEEGKVSGEKGRNHRESS